MQQQQQQRPFVYIFIPYQLPECSILSKNFALCEWRPKISSPECSTPMGERIYCHLQTDCFVLSELFSMAKYVGRSKLGSKPIQQIFLKVVSIKKTPFLTNFYLFFLVLLDFQNFPPEYFQLSLVTFKG